MKCRLSGTVTSEPGDTVSKLPENEARFALVASYRLAVQCFVLIFMNVS